MKAPKDEFSSVRLLLLAFGLLSVLILTLCLSSRLSLPPLVGRSLTDEEVRTVISRNSPLTEYALLSPNATFPREEPITKITVHHMAGDLTLEELGQAFLQRDRRASANYAIDSEGRVALYVEEPDRAWTSSSADNDHRAVTIEVANDEIGGDWHVSDEAFETLVALCTDICRRSGMEALTYTGDADGSLTIHKMFHDTDCPGPYLESRMDDLANQVNLRLALP